MATVIEDAKQLVYSKSNAFYRQNYHYLMGLIATLMVILILAMLLVLIQLTTRPLPPFTATMKDGQGMRLMAFHEPNLLPETILRFSTKAATSAYTFNFVNYDTQIATAKPFFTQAGWADFARAIQPTVNLVVANQQFVSGVVAGPPVISNQGPLPGVDYAWRVQIPFLITYVVGGEAGDVKTRKTFVYLTIIRVPTSDNPQGIGIDQFIMV